MDAETQERHAQFAADAMAYARRCLEVGADIVLALIPGVAEETVLAVRSGDRMIVNANLTPAMARVATGCPEERYAAILVSVRAAWDRRNVRLLAVRSKDDLGAAPWRPDVSFPPEPAPNVDLSR